jgi:hypothetical protein
MATPHRLRHHAGVLRVVEWHVTRSLVEEDENVMGAEPGRPDELSPITRIDTARERPVRSAAGRSFIEPSSPGRNPFVESFCSRVRDELRIFRNPVLVGGGTPFLPPVTEHVSLDLIETGTFGSRVIYERYRRVRDGSY